MADEPLARVGKGDPITADWANAVADAINARGATDPNANGTATPYGIMTPADVDTQMRAPDAQAMPFDAAIIREGSDGDALYMALPNAPDYVFDGAGVLSPSPKQTLGTAKNAWVRIEAVTHDTGRYVSLAVTLPDSSTPPGWRLFVASSPTDRPSWADHERPVVLLAGYNIAADDTSGTDTAPGDVPSLLKGLVQYHRGTINLGAKGAAPMIYDCRFTGAAVVDPDTETASRHAEIYLGNQRDALWRGTRWSIQQGGYPIPLSGGGIPTGTAPGWYSLGALTAAKPAVWLCASSNNGGGVGAIAEIVVAANVPPTLMSDGYTPCNALLVARATSSDLATLAQYHHGAVDLPVGLGLPHDGSVTLDLCTPPRLSGRTLWYYAYTITILGGLVVDRSELKRKEIELPSDTQ